MIGFDSFILMKDISDDGTQCILDAYSEAGIVLRYKEDLHIDLKGQGEVFDACVDYPYTTRPATTLLHGNKFGLQHMTPMSLSGSIKWKESFCSRT